MELIVTFDDRPPGNGRGPHRLEVPVERARVGHILKWSQEWWSEQESMPDAAELLTGSGRGNLLRQGIRVASFSWDEVESS